MAFLKALTDPRVACHRAPFDHPSLLVPVGAKAADADHDGNADDRSAGCRRRAPAVSPPATPAS